MTKEHIVLQEIQLGPASVTDLENALIKAGVDNPQRVAKELAWKLAESGAAFFNDDWKLELCHKNQ